MAIVNDRIITQTDIEKFKRRLKSHFLIDEFLFFYVKTPLELLKNSDLLLSYMIDEKVLDFMIQERGIQIPSSRIQSEVNRVLKLQRITKDQLKAFLESKGFLFSDYEKFIEISLKRTQFIQSEVSSKVKVSEEDIASYYLSHEKGKNLENLPIFNFTLAHIFFSKSRDEQDPRHKGTPKEKAWRIFHTLKYLSKEEISPSSPSSLPSQGSKSSLYPYPQVSFEQLVTQFSEEPSPSLGGIIGSFTLAEMLPEFQSVVKKMQVGGISKPVETERGFHVLKLVKKILIEHPKVKKRKEKIRKILLNQRLNQQFQSWIEESRKKSFIHRLPLSSLRFSHSHHKGLKKSGKR